MDKNATSTARATIDNRKRWARVYFFILEGLVLVPFTLGFISEIFFQRPLELEGFVGYAVIGLYIVSLVLLLFSSFFLLRIERWLGIAAIITVFTIFLIGLLIPGT